MKNFLLLITLIFAISLSAKTDPNDLDALKDLEGKWSGTLERTNGTSDDFKLEYKITSNGSALLEESLTGEVEMLTIFNFQNNELLLTHYCALQNKPVSVLETNSNGKYTFKTDFERSGLTTKKDTFVTSWKIDLMPSDKNKMYYEYTVSGPEGEVFTATAVMTRI